LLSRTCREAWRAAAVKRKALRASGVRRELEKLRNDPAAALDDHEGDAARIFVSAVQAANRQMGFDEVVGRAISHATEHPGTRLPNRGRSAGTTGNPAFNTFCRMLLCDVGLVGGRLTCWRIGGRIARGPAIGSAECGLGRRQDRARGTAKGSFVLALVKLKPYLPPGFVPVSDPAIVLAYQQGIEILRESEKIPVFFGSSTAV
jgi:hypothetical protein